MSLRLSLKWAIYLVIIIAGIALIPQILAGNPRQAGENFGHVFILCIVILGIGTWDEYAARKEGIKIDNVIEKSENYFIDKDGNKIFDKPK